MSLAQLTDACKVVSVLDPKVRRDLLKWFIGNSSRLARSPPDPLGPQVRSSAIRFSRSFTIGGVRSVVP